MDKGPYPPVQGTHAAHLERSDAQDAEDIATILLDQGRIIRDISRGNGVQKAELAALGAQIFKQLFF